MSATKKGRLCMKVQVNGSERLYVLWPMKYCTKAGANIHSLTYKLLQGRKIISDCKNNIVKQSTDGKIILDCQIKN